MHRPKHLRVSLKMPIEIRPKEYVLRTKPRLHAEMYSQSIIVAVMFDHDGKTDVDLLQ